MTHAATGYTTTATEHFTPATGYCVPAAGQATPAAECLTSAAGWIANRYTQKSKNSTLQRQCNVIKGIGEVAMQITAMCLATKDLRLMILEECDWSK